MNTASWLNWMLYPILAGVLALLLLCVSAWEFRKPSAVAKLTGFTWSAFGVGSGSLALMLYITTGASWPLQGNDILGAVNNLLLGLTALCIMVGIALLAVVAKAKGEQKAVTKRIVQPPEGVWPPPPKKP